MNHQKTLLALALIASATATSTAHASLSTNGNGLIYDNVSNITFTGDANLFKTMAASVTGLINKIISDTPTVDVHTMGASDFSAGNGKMNWWGAEAWIGYLNKTSYDDYSNWSLPTTSPTVPGYNKTGSQLGELFYTELEGVKGNNITATHNANYNLFTNIPDAAVYWSGTNNVANSSFSAWYFDYTDGSQGYANKSSFFNVLAILPGNASIIPDIYTAAAIPVPGAVWLFVSGLLGLLGFKKRGNIG